MDDVTGVFDAEGNQVFELASAIKATVNPQKKVMEHPVEDGTTVSDHVVIQPIEIELSLLITGENFADTYQEIYSLYTDSEVLTVQTKTGNYSNQIIQSIAHDESPDMATGITMAMKLKEVKFVEAVFGKLPPEAVKHTKNQSTQDRGKQTGDKPASDKAKEQTTQAIDTFGGTTGLTKPAKTRWPQG